MKKKEEENNQLFIERPCKLHFYIFGKLKSWRFQKYILLLGYLALKWLKLTNNEDDWCFDKFLLFLKTGGNDFAKKCLFITT